MNALPRNAIVVGDARTRLTQLPAATVDCVITSPPYFQLRNYGAAGQLGLEPTVNDWVEQLRLVLADVARVLKTTGSLWLNLGDSYSRHQRYGAAPKGLLLAPERLLLSLVNDGWICRNKVVWAKTNPLPSSVGDRLSATYELVYFFVRSRRYFFDLDAIRQPHRSRAGRRGSARPLGYRPGRGHWPVSRTACAGRAQPASLAMRWARIPAMSGQSRPLGSRGCAEKTLWPERATPWVGVRPR